MIWLVLGPAIAVSVFCLVMTITAAATAKTATEHIVNGVLACFFVVVGINFGIAAGSLSLSVIFLVTFLSIVLIMLAFRNIVRRQIIKKRLYAGLTGYYSDYSVMSTGSTAGNYVGRIINYSEECYEFKYLFSMVYRYFRNLIAIQKSKPGNGKPTRESKRRSQAEEALK